MTVTGDVESVVAARLVDWGLDRGAPPVAALSGGGDSTALVHVLARLQGRGVCRWTAAPIALHVHHGLRAGADADAACAARTAAALGLRFVQINLNGAALRNDPRGVTAAARDARLKASAETAAARGASAVLTAHTADDVVETLIDRLTRGTGVTGIAGIPPRRGVFARPLLSVSREGLRAYLTALGAEWCDDPTNDDPAHTRARIRRTVVPAFAALRVDVRGAVRRLADEARGALAVVDAALGDDPAPEPDGWPVPPHLAAGVFVSATGAPDAASRPFVVRRRAHNAGAALTYDDVAAVLAVMDGAARRDLSGARCAVGWAHGAIVCAGPNATAPRLHPAAVCAGARWAGGWWLGPAGNHGASRLRLALDADTDAVAPPAPGAMYVRADGRRVPLREVLRAAGVPAAWRLVLPVAWRGSDATALCLPDGPGDIALVRP